jgi:hypothetical protein
MGKICKTSESVLLVEVGGSKVFEIDKCEKRENKEIATEIIGILLEDKIKEEVRSRLMKH